MKNSSNQVFPKTDDKQIFETREKIIYVSSQICTDYLKKISLYTWYMFSMYVKLQLRPIDTRIIKVYKIWISIGIAV